MADKSAAQRIKELDDERAKLISQAKSDALARASAALEELNSLGFSYSLVEGNKAPAAKPARTGTRQVKDADCPICKFRTEPPHDGRKHRSQPESRKKPFTAAELTDLGLKRAA